MSNHLDWQRQKERSKLRMDRAIADPKSGLVRLKAKAAAIKGMPKAARLGKCPLCGKQMKLHNGKNGMFAGCSGYPACTHTENFTKGR